MPKSFTAQGGSRKRHLLYGTAIGLLIATAHAEKVYAACSAAFDDTANVVFCTGLSSAIDALSGNDDVTLVQDFGANSAGADVAGNDGNDTLTLAGGSIDDALLGQNQDDTLIVGGFGSAAEVGGNVDGGAGSDRITIAALGSVGSVVQGNEGNDTIVMTGGGVRFSVAGFIGNDRITIAGGSLGAGVQGNDGDDTLSIAGGEIGDNVEGLAGNDTIVMAGGAVGVDVQGGDDDDRITIAGGSVDRDVRGDDGDDTLSIAGGEISATVTGSAGNDTIVMTGGAVGLNVQGGDANDRITIAGGSIGANVQGDVGDDTLSIAGGVVGSNVQGLAGDDTIVMTGGTVAVDIRGGDANDRITIAGGSVTSDVLGGEDNDRITIAGGSVRNVSGGGGTDTLSIASGSIGDRILGLAGNDTIVMTGGAVGLEVLGGADNDRITIAGGSVGFFVLGEAGKDTIVMTDGAVGDFVQGGSDDDQITIAGGFVGGDVRGDVGADTLSIAGGSIDDFVGGGDDDDTIVMTGGGVGLEVEGGAADDRITIAGGSVGANVLGDDGDDTLSIAGGEIGALVDGLAGNDTIVMTGGAVGVDIQGGDDDDLIAIAGGSFDRDVRGEGGADTLSIAGGEIGEFVRGEEGNDTIVMTGGGVGLEVQGGPANDRITIAGGSVGSDVEGNDGADTLSIAGGLIGGDIRGGDGADSLFISGGSMGDVLGGGDADVIEVSGTADLQSDAISGGAGDDVMRIAGVGDLSGAQILGETGNDVMELAGASGELSGAASLFGGSGENDIARFTAFAGVNAEEFGGYEQVLLLNGSTLDVHNPNAPTPNDATLGALASGADPFILYTDPSSTLFAGGNSPGDTTVVGNYANEGQLSMLDGTANDRFTVTGAYAGGDTGTLALDAALDATELADRFFLGTVENVNVPPPVSLLVPEGSTAVVVNDVGNGSGQLTGNQPGDGIAVIDVSGGSTDEDDFFLLGGPVQAGAVEYSLVLESNNIWYLQSEFLDQVFGYAAAPSAILTMARDYVGNLHERVGSLEQSWTGGATQSSDGSGVWLRSGGFFGKVDSGKDDRSFDYDQDHWFAQLGADLALLSDASTGRLIGSIMGHAGYSNTRQDENGNDLITENFIRSYGGGVALTWYGGPASGWAGEGLYVDGIAQVTFYDLETKTAAEGTRGETDGWGWSVGLEAGYGIDIGGGRKGPRLVPQIQIVYSQIDLDDFTDEDGVDVEFGKADSLQGRLGVAVDSGKLWRSVNAYAEADVVHEFLGDTDVTVSTLPVDYDLGGTAVELGLGGTVSLLDNVQLYADVDYLIPFDDGRQGASVIGGLRLAF